MHLCKWKVTWFISIPLTNILSSVVWTHLDGKLMDINCTASNHILLNPNSLEKLNLDKDSKDWRCFFNGKNLSWKTNNGWTKCIAKRNKKWSKNKNQWFKIVQKNLKSYHYFRTNFPNDFEKTIVFYWTKDLNFWKKNLSLTKWTILLNNSSLRKRMK